MKEDQSAVQEADPAAKRPESSPPKDSIWAGFLDGHQMEQIGILEKAVWDHFRYHCWVVSLGSRKIQQGVMR